MSLEPTYSRIAVVGTGGYAWHFLKALLGCGRFSQVRAVTRKAGAAGSGEKQARIEALRGLGADIVEYEQKSADVFKAAFDGMDTVISSVGISGVPDQILMIDGALLAGVKWFIPSEFGVAHYTSVWMPFASPLAPKTTVQSYLTEYVQPKGLAYTVIYTGLALDYLDPHAIGLNLGRGSATLVGRGGSPVSFTSVDDVVKLVVDIVQRPSEMQNRTIRYAASTAKMRELIKTVTRNEQGEHVKIVSIDEAKEKFCELAQRQDTQAFQIYCRLLLEEGLGQINRGRVPLDNCLFPSIKPESIQHTLRRLMDKAEAERLSRLKSQPAHRTATGISVTDGLGRMQNHLDDDSSD
ncbi:hypothetical protein GGF46_001291 [Coemansia sp. RSA 552]|nr:hypothetical protein GGF46_001291 [Coemansia sp. RSA 552]